MEDQGIVALFFERSEQAIVETDRKYGGYCYSIAYNMLSSIEDSEESVSDTYLTASAILLYCAIAVTVDPSFCAI